MIPLPMGPLDSVGMPSSLTQRRQAASNLPAFELPPPSHFNTPQFHKFPPLTGINGQSLPASVGNLLTPPPNSGSDSGTNSANINHNGMPVLPYTPSFWQGIGATPTFASHSQPWQNGSLFSGRQHMFTPAAFGRNDPNSPQSGPSAALPPPNFDVQTTQHYAQGIPHASPRIPVHQNTQHSAMNSHMQSRPASQRSPISPMEAGSKATSGPGIYASMSASSTPQPPYGFQNATTVAQSPHSISAPISRTSPPLQQGPMSQMHNSFNRPPYPSYSLPAMPGPLLTNVNNPGSQMSLVGNIQQQMMPMHFNSGYAANPQLAYAQARANSPQQAANQERPFKCDECPQSFNRNHDLKRHKRIHLAVKPFPCNHCDKSFSRKDALKRHILVKGCGKAGESDSNGADGVKSDSGSDTQDRPDSSLTV